MFADRWLSLPCALIFALSMIQSTRAQTIEPRFAVLVFSKTSGFRHSSIPQGIAAIKTLGAAYGFDVDATEDSARFTDVILANFRAVLFLNTTGTILDADQKAAFERATSAAAEGLLESIRRATPNMTGPGMAVLSGLTSRVTRKFIRRRSGLRIACTLDTIVAAILAAHRRVVRLSQQSSPCSSRAGGT